MKNLMRATMAAMTMAAIMTVAATSCQSEEERRDEELRNEQRSAIATIEGKQSEHVEVLNEYVELRNELNSNHNSMMSNTMAQAALREQERTRERYESGWQEEMRVRIDEASREELKRVALELSLLADSADSGKTIKEYNIRDIKHRETIPPEQRIP